MEDNSSMVPRVGTFFFVIGGLAWLLFIISDIIDQVDFGYAFWGTLCLAAGWFLRRLYYKPPPPSNRFSGLRTWLQKQREAKAKKEAEKKAKAAKK